MQNVKFNSLVEFIDFLPQQERQITLLLQDIIKTTLPEVKEKLSYNVPFYKLRKNICYIWPASILWGKSKSYEGVRLGFNYGYLIDPMSTYLNLGNRKNVAWIDITELELINELKIKHYLIESQKFDFKK